MSIKQAIEAMLHVRDCTYIDDNGRTALMNIYEPEHVDAALAALRSMPAEPYAYAVYFPDQPTEELVHDLDELLDDMTNREHTITELFATPPLAPVPFLPGEQERLTENGRKAWAGVDAQELRDGGPVLLTDAEIDAITVAQWGDRVLLAAYRSYARAIEQSVIARVGRGEL